jgi:glucuronoarabinoxylan endo-1,4-beta-xylanase
VSSRGRTSLGRVAGALLLVAAAACSGPQVGTQTNWLRACESDAQCGDGLRCWCGACTLVCEEGSSTCSDLGGAECVPAADSGAVALCDGSAPPFSGACLLRCEDGNCPGGTACTAGVCTPLQERTDVVTIDPSVRHQTLTGFGAGTVWLTDEIAQHPAADALYDALFAESGFDVVRMFNRYDDYGTSDLTTSVAILSAAAERLGAPPTLLLSSTSPPAALKANGSELCSGNPDTCTLARLADGSFDYAGFADHWRAVVEAYAAAGIEPDYISIQNDPEWVPPDTTESDACRFLPTEGTTTVDLAGTEVEVEYPGYLEALAAVKERLAGLPSVPQITAPDTIDVQTALSFASELDLSNLDAFAHHVYDIDPNDVDRELLQSVSDLGRDSGLPIFQTEAQANGIGTAILAHEALTTLGASMFLQNDFASSAFIDRVNPTALVALTETDFTLQDPYFALRHFAHDTDPGWVRIDADSEMGPILATGWLSPGADAVTLVLVNPGEDTVHVELELDGELSSPRVTRTVFPGIERFQELGALSPNGVVTVPGQSLVTVTGRL